MTRTTLALLTLSAMGGTASADVFVDIRLGRPPISAFVARPVVPVYPAPVVVHEPVYVREPIVTHRPVLVARGFDHRALEKHVERTIECRFGKHVDDVDVDIDCGCRVVKVEADVCHPSIGCEIERLLYSMPELAGYRIRLKIEVDD